MEAGRAPLTEEDIRERVTLRPEELAHVRVLSLPGTYHEKITHLGSSLKKFIHLKHLDLSRNALTSLEGLQHLTSLERLNLYFNQISTLSEVFRLQTLTALQEVDLRLNPVIKTELDYRPFVVHMLPNLRRLDDCPVRDRERKACLLHFTPEQAYEFKKPSEAPKEPQTGSTSVHKRTEYVYSLSKKCSMMDEDDEAVLNLIAKCDLALSKPLGVTGSTKRDPEVQFHVSNKCKNSSATPPVAVNREKGVNVACLEAKVPERPKRDPNLMFQDEAEAYDKVVGHVHFTPHPGANEIFEASEKKRHAHRKGHEPEDRKQTNKDMPQAESHLPSTLVGSEASMEHLLDLVDKYWNGCRSLHCNEEFLSQAGLVLLAMQKGEAADKCLPSPSVHRALPDFLQNNPLLEHLIQQDEQNTIRIRNLKGELSSAKKDLNVLKQHLHQVLEENEALKARGTEAKENALSVEAANAQQLQITKLQNQNQVLAKENASLKHRLQNFENMQELSQMLQESHKQLMSNNECLLQELDETRVHHKAEVEELHWSYNQLKKTIEPLPSNKENSRKS